MSARERLPNRRAHEIVEFEHAGIRIIGGVGRYENGKIAEVFVNAGKVGSHIESATRDAGVLASIALQHGASVADLQHSLQRLSDGRAAGPIGQLLDLID